jgi:hypothetical protein
MPAAATTFSELSVGVHFTIITSFALELHMVGGIRRLLIVKETSDPLIPLYVKYLGYMIINSFKNKVIIYWRKRGSLKNKVIIHCRKRGSIKNKVIVHWRKRY